MQSLQIAVSEIWVTLIFVVIMYLFRGELKQKKITKLLMLTCIARLLSDAVSWAFDGLPGVFWGTITRSSNYITFVTNDLVSLLFSVFLWSLIKKEGEKPGLILKAYWLLEGITIALLTLNLHFGWFYAFDSSNLYSRGDYYRFTHIAPIAAIFVVAWMLLWYRDRFSKNINVMGWTYFFFMAVATAYELTNFGLSFQTYAQTFSALVAFFVGEIEIRENLLVTHKKLEQANLELQQEEKKVKAALETEMKMDVELRERQEQLSLALAAAQQANRAKTMFLNNMSHDIRTPMNAIIGFTSLAASNINHPEKIKEYLKKITISSEHLLSLINDVLDMSRIESGKVKIDEKPLHLPALMHELHTIIQPSVASKQLDFLLDTVDVLDEDIIVDKLRLTQILLNILSNGVKYNKTGGLLALRIKQDKNAPAGYATYHFIVKDTGIGMSEEFQKHIFETFSREETATVSGIQGTGLGMAITKKIIEMMGGEITLTSTEGVGSEFDVCLTFKLSGEKHNYEKIESLQGLRVLVADDDTDTCLNIAKMLTEIGMRPEWTTSGKEAVVRTKVAVEMADEFYAYIIDWLMPDMNGIETVRRIRRLIGENKPIIILTAYDWSDVEEEARQAGVTAFCEKPLFMSELKNLLTNPVLVEEKHTVSAEDCKGKKILLVEDNSLNQEIAVAVLQGAGFVVDVVGDGHIAVEKMAAVKPGQYDLILMDVQMPMMNGYEATKRIRAMDNPYCKQIPIIAMTANAFEEDKALALQAGMNDYLAKPIKIDKMLKMISKVLKNKGNS